MNRILLFFESLENRERVILIAGIYFVVFVGLFIIPASYLMKKIERLEKKIQTEEKKYIRLQQIIYRYSKAKPREKNVLSLSVIDKLAGESGIRENVVSIKPTENGIEVVVENVDPDNLFEFLKRIKKKGFSVSSISINDPKGNRKLNVRMLIGKAG
ncbi:type II secretion system protein GspM [Persephonella sp.]